MNNKEKYRLLSEKEESMPLFLRAWWLDAVCGVDNWGVSIVEKGGRIEAALPYFIDTKLGMKYLIQPPLTQFLGPWLIEINAKQANRHQQVFRSK